MAETTRVCDSSGCSQSPEDAFVYTHRIGFDSGYGTCTPPNNCWSCGANKDGRLGFYSSATRYAERATDLHYKDLHAFGYGLHIRSNDYDRGIYLYPGAEPPASYATPICTSDPTWNRLMIRVSNTSAASLPSEEIHEGQLNIGVGGNPFMLALMLALALAFMLAVGLVRSAAAPCRRRR